MLNDTVYRQPRAVMGKLRAAIGDATTYGKAHIHEVGYQLRLSFVIVVAIPTAIALIYYLLIAAPRYVATAQYAVWTSTPAKADPLAMLVQLPAASASLEDQHIVQDYVNSRSMLESIEKSYDLGRVYGSGGDIFAELGSDLPIERRVDYWKRHVRITIDSNSGISTLEVDAFRPEDALMLSNAVLARAQTMAQSLSDASDQDALRRDKVAFDAAGQHLAAIRTRVTAFRRQNHMVDATHTGQMTTQMVGALETGLVETEAELQQLRSYLSPRDPRIAVLQARADSLRQQIDLQKNGLAENREAPPSSSASAADVLPASVLAQSEGLETDMDVALKAYAAAATTYFEALGNQSRNRRYLEVFVKPALPELAEEPKRMRMILTVLVSSFIAWCLLITIGGAIRDHAGV